MARWGLPQEMRETRPWALEPSLTATAKVITDPVHGDIFITELERRLIDSPPFQRLRRVRQLGNTHLVYPGTSHTRFAHSLGTLRVAQDLMDAVVDQELGPHPQPRDLFSEWKQEGRDTYLRRVAEATVLARLGGLLHDLTHIPFGHTIEDDLGLLLSHDENRRRFRFFWGQFDADLRRLLERGGLDLFLQPLIVSKIGHKNEDGSPKRYSEMVEALGGEAEDARQYEFVADIVGNTICADLLDYLQRDHLNAGLPLALGVRYLAYSYVTPTRGYHYYPARLVLRIQRKGQPRADVVTELLKHLRYRYELSERVLVHHAKLSADAMIGKALSMWGDTLWVERALKKLGRDPDDASATDPFALRDDLAKLDKDLPRTLDNRVQADMERELRRRGDDGFLEWLLDWSEPQRSSAQRSRRAAVHALTDDLLNRRLFKPIAKIASVAPGADVLYRHYRGRNERRQLEQAAGRFAGVEREWNILVWIPEPGMRLKIAEVLVDTGDGIRRFVDQESRGDKRGADIYDAHRDLWAVSVFVHPELKEDGDKVDAILAYLSTEFEVRVDNLGFEDIVTPAEAPDLAAVKRVLRDNERFASLRGSEAKLLDMLQRRRLAKRTPPAPTIDGRIAEVAHVAEALDVAKEVLREDVYALVRSLEPRLYGRVLTTPRSGEASGTERDELREAFRAAAQAELADPTENGGDTGHVSSSH
jgi:HD superfamily phosphohydrolase